MKSKPQSKKTRVTEYTNPDDPDGTKLVIPGTVDSHSLKIASEHFGCKPSRIATRSLTVTDEYLKGLPEYDG